MDAVKFVEERRRMFAVTGENPKYSLFNIGSHVTTIVFSTVDGLREQYGVNPSSFGKTVFLTREEAEKALEAMK